MVIDKEISEVVKFPSIRHEPGSIGFIEKLIIGQLLMISKPKLIVETGTFHGQTTRFMSEFIELNKLRECIIATFDLENVHDELKDDQFFKDNSKIDLVSGFLPETLHCFLEKKQCPIDFAVVDAQHSYEAVLSELKIIHQWLKAGGYVFCHDYRENDPKYKGVVYAIRAFAKTYHYDILPLNECGEKGEEIVWGTALLRKPSKRIRFVDGLIFRMKSTFFPFLRKIKKAFFL